MNYQPSNRCLKIFSGIFWYAGCFVLVLKGSALLIEAWRLRPDPIWPWLAMGVSLFFGGLKAKYVFNGFCRENLVRIEALNQPKPWQFFRPAFFGVLFLMIVAGAFLSGLAQHNYPALIAVAMLDFSIATALAFSSFVYWTSSGFWRA